MKNVICFENGLSHEFTDEELKLLKLFASERAEETAEKYNVDLDIVMSLKALFCDYLD